MSAATDVSLSHVSALVVNYQTPDLVRTAVESFKRFYPDVDLTVIDNGSRDNSQRVISGMAESLPNVRGVYLRENIFHGPGMHLGISRSTTPFVYVFDSDTEALRGGFLEALMSPMAKDQAVYGTGHVVHVDQRGFTKPTGVPVLSSAHMLLRTALYRSLPPFVHHGLPTLANFKAAHDAGYRLVSCPLGEHVRHLGRGTAARYGYGLGLRAKLDYVLAKLGL